jgi:hypothetical protein
LDFHVFGKLKKTSPEVWDFHLTTPSKPRSWNGFGSGTSPSATRAWKTSSYVMTSDWTSVGTIWKNRALMFKHTRILFLFLLCLLTQKK